MKRPMRSTEPASSEIPSAAAPRERSASSETVMPTLRCSARLPCLLPRPWSLAAVASGLGRDDEPAIVPLALAPGAARRVRWQREMHDAPVPRTHRVQRHDPARRPRLGGEPHSQLLERLLPPLPVTLHVQAYPQPGVHIIAENNTIHYVLERVQGLPPASDDHATVAATERKANRASVVRRASALLDIG